MGLFLKQSTGVTVQIGPFVDEDDGKTAETGLTLTQGDIRLSKNGGNMAQKNDANAATHDEIGYYSCALDSTDTNTLGRLQLMVHESGALPVYHEYMVVTAHVYDTFCSTDYLQVDVIQVGSATQSATDLKDFADTGYDPATHKVQGVVLTDTTTAVTNTVNLSAATETQIDNIETDTNELQTDWTNGGRLDLLIDAIKAVTDAMPDAGALNDLATILTDTNELQTDWTNGGRLDLLIDAIKAKTDNLPADPADDSDLDTQLAANAAAIAALNDISVADITSAAVDGAITVKQAVAIILAAVAGKSSGGGTASIKFRDVGDAKDRISATVDANGNRTAITIDGA